MVPQAQAPCCSERPHPTPNPWTPRRAGCAKVQLSFFTDLTPSLQGDGHGVHHLDRAAVCFAGVVVRGHGFILGQAAVGKAQEVAATAAVPRRIGVGMCIRGRSLDE